MVKQVKQNRSSGSAWIRTCRSKVSEQHIAELIMARVMEGDSEEEIASEVATLRAALRHSGITRLPTFKILPSDHH